MKIVTIDGNEACSASSYYFTEVAGIYPITPSSPMAENTKHLFKKHGLSLLFDSAELFL